MTSERYGDRKRNILSLCMILDRYHDCQFASEAYVKQEQMTYPWHYRRTEFNFGSRAIGRFWSVLVDFGVCGKASEESF